MSDDRQPLGRGDETQGHGDDAASRAGNQPGPPVKFEIQIDRKHYTVHQSQMTGAELRQIPPEPIAPDRDLFEVVPGEADRKVEDADVVTIRNGKRFFTAPGHINPGYA